MSLRPPESSTVPQTELVAIRASSAATFVRAWDQAWSAGQAVLPLDPSAPDGHTADLVRRFRPSLLLAPYPGHPERLRSVRLPDAAPVPDDTAFVVATSGSTGRPKGVRLTHAAVQASIEASVRRLACVDGERWLLCLPWHHVAGLAVVLRSRALGTEPVLHEGFDVAAVAVAADRGEARWISLVPTQLRRLLDAGATLDGLRGVLLGGAAADPGLLADAAGAGVRVTTSYGMTETFGGCVYDGEPLAGVSASVDGDGRIHLGGPMVAAGYHLDAGTTLSTFRGSVVATNDLGRFDDGGRLEVLGRMDDVIVSGGENVPAEKVLERVLEHPGIADALVVGIPDELWGTIVAVAIVPDGPPPTLDQVRDHVAEAFPRAWAPRRLAVVPRIPRTALGKPNRDAIRRRFG